MPVSTAGLPVHGPLWRRPIAYSETVADPPRVPLLVALRGSCGHLHGVGIVWHRQRYVAWRRCRP